MNIFEQGKSYTRSEIRAKVGGGLQSCFLTANRKVVGICLKTELNPEAPGTVLVGRGRLKERAAQKLLLQGTSIPAFLKAAVNDWRYIVEYEAVGCSYNPSEIAKHAKRAGRTDIAAILSMKEHLA